VRAVTDRIRRGILAPVRLEVDFLLVVGVLLAWQAIRIPLEGSVGASLDNARALLDIQAALALDIEGSVIDATRDRGAHDLLTFAYEHIHLPMLLAFLAAARLAAPARYPLIRLTLFASYLPAAVLIGLIPTAPPRWLPELGSAGPPTDAQLTATTSELLQNSTAAIASQHFGYALLIAAGSLWLCPRSPLARALVLYPAFVFLVVVATANHYVLDCVIGALTIGFGAAVAAAVANGVPRPRLQPARAVVTVPLVGVAFALGVAGLITASVCALVLAVVPALARAVKSGRDSPKPIEATDRA
jgi:PAP2 superfamily